MRVASSPSLCVYVASSKYSSGDKYDRQELTRKFWTNDANRKGFKFPANRLLKIGKTLTRQLLAKPDCVDEFGDPLYVVGNYGSKTDLTLGRYSGLEGYISTDIGLESRELIVYNFDLASGDFSDHGDSGALMFNGEGGGLALLHSGMPRGISFIDEKGRCEVTRCLFDNIVSRYDRVLQ